PGICWRAGHAVKVPTAPPAAERGARPRAGSPVRWTGTCLRRPRRSLPRRVRRPDSGSPAEVRPDRPRRGRLVAGRRRHEAGAGGVRGAGRTLGVGGRRRFPRWGWGRGSGASWARVAGWGLARARVSGWGWARARVSRWGSVRARVKVSRWGLARARVSRWGL